jgi:hypothetical protein
MTHHRLGTSNACLGGQNHANHVYFCLGLHDDSEGALIESSPTTCLGSDEAYDHKSRRTKDLGRSLTPYLCCLQRCSQGVMQ